jgi:dTDP-glucose 4,6-dehydratase
VSKLAGDLHLQTLRNFPSIILRPSNCYGEAQQLYRIVPKAAWCAATHNRVPLQGGGHARKSYMHTEDLSRAIVTAAMHGRVGRIYNAGPEKPLTIREIVEAVARASNIAADDLIETAPPREGEDDTYWISSNRLRMLGWAPTVDLDDGIQRMRTWVKTWLPDLGTPREFVLRA